MCIRDRIYFDPNERTTFIEEDKLLLEQYYEFEDMLNDCMEKVGAEKTEYSKWITRIEIDPEILLNKNITMDDIHFAIKNSAYGSSVQCIYSDYNSDKLVFRDPNQGHKVWWHVSHAYERGCQLQPRQFHLLNHMKYPV